MIEHLVVILDHGHGRLPRPSLCRFIAESVENAERRIPLRGAGADSKAKRSAPSALWCAGNSAG
jgi:hypothetical protein